MLIKHKGKDRNEIIHYPTDCCEYYTKYYVILHENIQVKR